MKPALRNNQALRARACPFASTVSDMAALLNISERQVYKLAADGSLPCFRIGGSVRFDPSAMAAWLRSTEKLGPSSVDAKGHARARRA